MLPLPNCCSWSRLLSINPEAPPMTALLQMVVPPFTLVLSFALFWVVWQAGMQQHQVLENEPRALPPHPPTISEWVYAQLAQMRPNEAINGETVLTTDEVEILQGFAWSELGIDVCGSVSQQLTVDLFIEELKVGADDELPEELEHATA